MWCRFASSDLYRSKEIQLAKSHSLMIFMRIRHLNEQTRVRQRRSCVACPDSHAHSPLQSIACPLKNAYCVRKSSTITFLCNHAICNVRSFLTEVKFTVQARASVCSCHLTPKCRGEAATSVPIAFIESRSDRSAQCYTVLLAYQLLGMAARLSLQSDWNSAP